jgi:hypothetical protein
MNHEISLHMCIKNGNGHYDSLSSTPSSRNGKRVRGQVLAMIHSAAADPTVNDISLEMVQ